MRRINFIAPVLILAALSACSGKSNLEPPTPLVKFKPSIKILKSWSVDTGKSATKKFIVLTPALDGERVFTAGISGKISAYSLKKGRKIWSVNSKYQITGAVGLGPNRLYIGTKNAKVVAFDKKSGKQLWKSRVTSEILTPPVSRGGLVVVQTVDGRIHGLAARNGERLWVRNWSVPALSLRGTSRPLFVRNMIISGLANGKVVAIEARSGRILREFVVALPQGNNEIDRLVDIDASPIIIGRKLISAGYRGNIMAIDLKDGRLLWKKKASVYTGMDGDRDNVYLTDDAGHVMALQHDTGATVWVQKKLQARRLNAPIVMDDYIAIGDLKGYVHLLSREDGRFMGRVKVSGSPIQSRMLVQDDVLYVSDQSGKLTALRIN